MYVCVCVCVCVCVYVCDLLFSSLTTRLVPLTILSDVFKSVFPSSLDIVELEQKLQVCGHYKYSWLVVAHMFV